MVGSVYDGSDVTPPLRGRLGLAAMPGGGMDSVLKRLLDVVLAGAMLLVASPLVLAAAAAIKLEDGGPVYYRQQRWGRRGRPFTVLKFRTMMPEAESLYGITSATERDPRVTAVGRLLRATGFDELPQLVSILTGQMSFVGPRALAIGEVAGDGHGQHAAYEDVPGFRERLSVRPGLTSLATVFLAKDSSPERKFRYDLLYVRKRSLWLDLYLIGLSFWISLRGRWETRGRKV